MRSLQRLAALAVVLFLSAAGSVGAEPPQTFRVLQGLVDRDGQPVEGAKVWAWYVPGGPPDEPMQISNDQGLVIFNDVPARGTWLFVEADGFRFDGTFVDASTAAGTLTLVRTTETPTEPLRTLEPRRPGDDVLKRAETAWREFARDLIRQGEDDPMRHMGNVLATYDPEFAVQLYEENHIGESGVKSRAARSLAVVNPERADEILSTISDPYMKAWGLFWAAKEILPHNRKQAIEWLQQGRSAADDIIEIGWRAANLAAIAGAWRELGDNAEALDVLRQGAEEARKSSGDELSKYGQAYVAWTLAPLDLQAALDLMPIPLDADLPDKDDIAKINGTMPDATREEREQLMRKISLGFDHGRYYGNAAHNLARVNPAEAERLLTALGPRSFNSYVMRVCYRMASVDFDRAKRIATSVEDPLIRAFALGVLADAIAESDNEQARTMIDDAFTFLIENPEARSGILTSTTVALGLLPSVERVEPSLLHELIWRTIALRAKADDPDELKRLKRTLKSSPLRSGLTAEIAAGLLARYDPELARPLSLSFGGGPRNFDWIQDPTFCPGAMAAIDPDAALEAAIAMPHDTEDRRNMKAEAWEQILSVLARSPDERWNWIIEKQLHQWSIDKFDL